MIEKGIKGGLTIVGQLNLGGSLDLVYNAVNLAELAVEKGATTLLIPINSRKQLNDLSDDMITKINIQYYADLKDCLIKALLD
jgi:ATP-dependent Lon protease